MSAQSRKRAGVGWKVVTVVLVASVLGVGIVSGQPAARVKAAPPQPNGGATFDFFSMFPDQFLSPEGGETGTSMPLDTRNIGDSSGRVTLTVKPDSSWFKASVKPDVVEPVGTDGKASSRVYVECGKETPDGTIGWIEVVGKRGAETHHIWLKATVLASDPRLDLSRGPVMGCDPGYLDAEMQLYKGEPVSWHVAARNEGAVDDAYPLSFRSDAPFDVTFTNQRGDSITSVKVPGKTPNLLYSRPIELKVQAEPTGGLPVGKPQEITLVIGPGSRSRATGELKVSVLNPGELFCVNALDGLSARAHQVRPAETTSFIFHVTNLSDKTRVMEPSFPQTADQWRVQRVGAQQARLKPGESAAFTMKVTPPRTSGPGDRREFTVTLAGPKGGAPASSTVAVEVTDQRNVYYWSIDSMDPEYLYLDSKGTAQGSDGDWLMPNTQKFLKESANYTDARCYLPTATDMNHTNALAGTYTGTMGVYMVAGTFRGFTEHDETLSSQNSMSLMRCGPDGVPIERSFEVAKRETGGKATTGFWSNKNWLAELEGERGVDIVGHSENWPLFMDPPYTYKAAGDPPSDTDPDDPISVTVKACFHSNNSRAVLIPTMLGEFDLMGGMKLLSAPLAVMFGKTPGMHAEDAYIANEFFRSIDEQDPDVAYINVGDLDNTGHFTGASWTDDEWKKGDGPSPAYDVSNYSPDMRRKDCIDIAREADILFGRFLSKLKARGVYDNSTVIVLSDHGMENMKDPKSGYEVLDLRDILREHGLVRHEDYEEVGGTELNLIWAEDPATLAMIQGILEDYTVDDKELGAVKPLIVVNRREAREGKDLGQFGKVRPGELYSEYWTAHPDSAEGSEIWPDLFVFPVYNYQVLAHGDALASGINNVGLSFGINVPESVKFGLPAAHGGPQTDHIPLIFKSPAGVQGGPVPGTTHPQQVEIGDIAPTIYSIMGWTAPPYVDGKPL